MPEERPQTFFNFKIFALIILFLLPAAAYDAYELAYWGKAYPGVKVSSKFKIKSSKPIKLAGAGGEWEKSTDGLKVSVDAEKTQQKLLETGRSGSWRADAKIKLQALKTGVEVDPVISFNRGLVEAWVNEVGGKIDYPPIEPKFRLAGGRVIEFRQGKPGLKTDHQLLAAMIIEEIISLNRDLKEEILIDIPVDVVEPLIKTEQLEAAEMGIIKRLGKGLSVFKGSAAGREHNILLTGQRLDGVLVPPEAIFSFNDVVGEITKETGYEPAYIIKDGRTVLDDGGGVCQVSTTLFRAVLAAGFPVVERQAHSYRVSYYEQNSPPGFDATVYAPTADFKFKNDTPAYILIQADGNSKTDILTIEIWGTSDERTAATTDPVVWDQIPPPEDLYQDDPNLPAGTIKQVDWKAWGAKVKFDYRVERSGEILIQKTFYSNYRPWQAVFLRGTGG